MMKNTTYILMFFSILSGYSYSQTSLTVGGSAPTTADGCTELFVGNSVTLAASASCPLDIEILIEKGPNLTFTGQVFDTMKVSPYVLPLDSVGVYTFTCLNNNKDVANQCYHVLSEPIPTVGEWGLIILALLISIIAVVAIRQNSTQAA